MPSKGVLGRQQVGQDLLHATRIHAQEVGERLQTILAPVLEEGETLPDFTELLLLFARLLERRAEDLHEAGAAHHAEQDDDLEPRERRELACAALRMELADLRDAVRVAYDSEEVLTGLSLDGTIPCDPLTLHRLGTTAVQDNRSPVRRGP